MKRTTAILTIALWAALGALACSDDDGNNDTCPAGQVKVGDKCVPATDGGVLDQGPGVDQRPGVDQGPGDDGAVKPDMSGDGPVAGDGPTPDGAAADQGPQTDSTPPANAVIVFDDNYGNNMSFAPFGGATNKVSVDSSTKYSGTASLKIELPASGYTGGAIVVATGQDLSKYDALTFYAKASAAVTLDKAGFGNDAASTDQAVEYANIALTTTWQKVIVPIPLASKLTAVKGLFHFAEGPGSVTVWLDDVRYETLGSSVIGTPTAAIATASVNVDLGKTTTVSGTVATFPVNGTNQTLLTAPSYFTFSSSDTSVATVDAKGVVTGKAVGTAEITAKLGTVSAAGKLTVTVAKPTTPTAGAPTPPALAASKVISLFSDAFTDVSVDTWSATWDSADVADSTIGSDNVKLYTNLVFAGIEFTSSPVDASNMNHFHIDIWTPNATSFKIKLVDFGADKKFGGGDDTEHELTYDSSSTPAITTGSWISFDIPLSSFTNMTGKAALAQMILSSSTSTVYVDNVYFYQK